ncbi:MAG: SCO family protein, partial [Bacteroidota bacterium]
MAERTPEAKRLYRRRVLITAAVVFVFIGPLVIFAFFGAFAEQRFVQLPVYGHHDVAEGDTLFHRVPDFTLVNQDGDTVTQDDWRGNFIIVDFFFTTCPGICPRLSKAMVEVQQKTEGWTDVKLMSISIDPDYDRPDTLKAYAKRYDADHKRWSFLTGERETIFQLANMGMLSIAGESDAPGNENGLIHDNKLILIDPDLRVRGYYKAFRDGQGFAEIDPAGNKIKSLIGELKLLKHEYRLRKKGKLPEVKTVDWSVPMPADTGKTPSQYTLPKDSSATL